MIDTIDRMFLKVGQLYSRQSFAIDDGDASAWADTFAQEGIFISPSYPDPVSGREELATFARKVHADSRAEGKVQRHVVTNPMVFRTNDGKWWAKAYLGIVATGSDGAPAMARFTTVEDELRVVDGQLEIVRRTVSRDIGAGSAHSDTNNQEKRAEKADMDTYGEFEIPTATRSEPAVVVYPEMAGKVAVVTGGAQGMGAVFVRCLVAQGVNVIAADLSGDLLAETVDTINAEAADGGLSARAVAHQVDVTVRKQLDDLADSAVSRFGGLDYWVNNAGIFPFSEFEDVDDDQISAVLDVNVKGVLFGAQAAARHMGPGAAIVNMSSVSALRVRRGRGAYCTSKAAVAHLTESMAVELGDKGIRVNSIAPGYIDTAMTLWVREDPEALANALTNVPLHRLGSPEEVASPLLFLLSDSARYITGHSIAVDGGSRHV